MAECQRSHKFIIMKKTMSYVINIYFFIQTNLIQILYKIDVVMQYLKYNFSLDNTIIKYIFCQNGISNIPIREF